MAKKLLLCIGIVLFTNILFASTPPKIFNFRIEASEPDRVYFDSESPITGSSFKGFTVSNRSIINISINEGELSSHYVTVSEKFTFWDNNTIRYEGGSNIEDNNGNSLIEFTLSYIKNNIPEPEANDDRYVTTSATGGGNGKSEKTAWTLEEAFSKANAGITVWIKAGNYGNQNLSLYNDGTSISPLKFIGYKNSPGDITKNYYDYGKKWSTSEMPTLTGKSASNGHAIQLRGVNYVVFRNLQITNYQFGVRANNTNNSNLVFDRINGNTFGDDSTRQASFLTFASYAGGDVYNFVYNDHFKVLNCVSVNASMSHISFRGYGSALIDGCKVYSDRLTANARTDYMIQFNGHNNIVRNCYIENFNNTESNGSTHGIGVRGSTNLSNNYNLIEKSTAINLQEGFYIRNYGCEYNVIKDVYVGNNGASSYEDRGGVWIWGGSNYNIIERAMVENVDFGIGFFDNAEEGNINNNEIGHDNIIRNSIFKNTKYSVHVSSENPNGAKSLLKDNKIVNCTFDTSLYILKNINSNIQNLQFINNSITNHTGWPEVKPYPDGLVFKNNNFYGNRDNYHETGNGNINLNPNLDSDLKPTTSTSTAITEGGQVLNEVKYDYDGKYRGDKNTIGAYQYGEDTTGSIDVNAGKDVEICFGDTTTLAATGDGSILWSTGETTNSITVSPEETTTYKVTLTNEGNVATDEVVVTITKNPEVTLGDDKTICKGDEVTLYAQGSGTFLWSTGETTQSITVSPLETSAYSVQATITCEGSDFSVSDTVMVNVNEIINLSTTEDMQICKGSEVTLTAESNTEVLWSTGETTNSITVSPSETITYSVTAGNGFCSKTEEIKITVSETASVSLGPDISICYGEEVLLTATGTGEFLWNTGETSKTIKVNPLVATTYSVTATSVCGDTAMDEILVNVNKELMINAGEDKSICVGESVVLTAEGNGNYLWSTGETSKSITVSPNKPDSYWVSNTNGNCSVSDEVFVDVQKAAAVSLGDDFTICSGEVVTLTASGYGDYLWNTGATTSSISVSPTQTTTYAITASSNACTADAKDEITIFVNESVHADAGIDITIEPNESTTLTATGGTSYLWSTGETTASILVQPESTTVYTVEVGNGTSCGDTDDVKVTVGNIPLTINNGEDITICSGDELVLQAQGSSNYLWSNGQMDSKITVDPEITTTYTVSAQKNGILETTSVTVTVEDCSANRAINYDVYPNPTADILNINIPLQKESINITVHATDGKILFTKKIKADNNGIYAKLNLSHLSNGIYFIKMVNENFNQTKKIIVL